MLVQLARARGARVVASASAQREALLRDLDAEVFLDRHAVVDLTDAAAAHRRVESGRGQGKVVLRVAG